MQEGRLPRTDHGFCEARVRVTMYVGMHQFSNDGAVLRDVGRNSFIARVHCLLRHSAESAYIRQVTFAPSSDDLCTAHVCLWLVKYVAGHSTETSEFHVTIQEILYNTYSIHIYIYNVYIPIQRLYISLLVRATR